MLVIASVALATAVSILVCNVASVESLSASFWSTSAWVVAIAIALLVIASVALATAVSILDCNAASASSPAIDSAKSACSLSSIASWFSIIRFKLSSIAKELASFCA